MIICKKIKLNLDLSGILIVCSRGETDIITGFEPVVGGSNPSESTKVY
jgi:hypothetical protein